MTKFDQYIEDAKKTESLPLDLTVDVPSLVSVLHLVSATTQLLDLYKKQMFYKKNIDIDVKNQLLDSIQYHTNSIVSALPSTESPVPVRLSHSIIGIATEAGELVDALIPVLDADYPIDTINFKEELGDLMWYAAIGIDEKKLALQDILDTNIRKLQDKKKGRYSTGQFSEVDAIERNINNEREILEA